MIETSVDIKGPLAWLPAGLISWYAPGGSPVALVTSWLALIGGKGPRIRTAWHGRQDPLSRFWPGGDFVLNVPSLAGLQYVQRVMERGYICLTAKDEFPLNSASGIAAEAPRLLDCVIQIECVGGKLVDVGSDVELCGEVVRVHRDSTVINPADIAGLCAINPLSPIV